MLERRGCTICNGPSWPPPPLLLVGPGSGLTSARVLGGHRSFLGLLAWVESSSQLRVSRVGPDAGPHHTLWASCCLGCELLAAPAGFWPRALQASLPFPLNAVCFSCMCGPQGSRPCIKIGLLFKKPFILYLLVLFLFSCFSLASESWNNHSVCPPAYWSM